MDLAWFIFLSFVIWYTKANRCTLYKAHEVPPLLYVGARFGRTCIPLESEQFEQYCVEWDCPNPMCSDPVVPETGCPICNGTCMYYGKVYEYGEKFQCADGCNRCLCGPSITTTFINCLITNPPPELSCKPYGRKEL